LEQETAIVRQTLPHQQISNNRGTVGRGVLYVVHAKAIYYKGWNSVINSQSCETGEYSIVVSPAWLGTKNDCVGEGQQQIYPNDQKFVHYNSALAVGG
jgi:hypothetical protein